MSDMYNGLYVVFEDELDQEALGKMVIAIKQMRGVLSVQPHVRTWDDSMALDRARFELRQQVWKVLYPESNK